MTTTMAAITPLMSSLFAPNVTHESSQPGDPLKEVFGKPSRNRDTDSPYHSAFSFTMRNFSGSLCRGIGLYGQPVQTTPIRIGHM